MKFNETQDVARDALEAAATICEAEGRRARSKLKDREADAFVAAVNLDLKLYALACDTCAENIRKHISDCSAAPRDGKET